MLLGVEHFVVDAFLAQVFAEQFRHFDRGGADQHRLAALVGGLDLARDRAVLAVAVEEHRIRVVLADHRAVGRDDDHFQPVDALEFVGLGVGRTGHARELAVHAEQVLEGDAGERLVLALHRHAFLRLDRLVQTVGPATARQRATGELVDDDDLAVAHDVVVVALVDRVCAQAGIQVMHDMDVLRRVQAVVAFEDAGAAQQFLGVFLTGFGQVDLLALLVDPEIAVAVFGFLADQRRDDAVDLDVELRRIVGRAGDDQRRARFVDQDRVDLVDDRVVQTALVTVRLRQRQDPEPREVDELAVRQQAVLEPQQPVAEVDKQ